MYIDASRHIFVPALSPNMDFQYHMSLSFDMFNEFEMSSGERLFLDLLILMTITV